MSSSGRVSELRDLKRVIVRTSSADNTPAELLMQHKQQNSGRSNQTPTKEGGGGKQERRYSDPSGESLESTPTAATNPATTKTAAPAAAPRSRTRSTDEIDEEIRMAQAMAMAQKNNPHMSPDEIRKMVGAPQSAMSPSIGTSQHGGTFSGQVHSAGQKLTSFFQSATTSFDVHNKIPASSSHSMPPSYNPSAAAAPLATAAENKKKSQTVSSGFKSFTKTLKAAAKTNLGTLTGTSSTTTYSSTTTPITPAIIPKPAVVPNPTPIASNTTSKITVAKTIATGTAVSATSKSSTARTPSPVLQQQPTRTTTDPPAINGKTVTTTTTSSATGSNSNNPAAAAGSSSAAVKPPTSTTAATTTTATTTGNKVVATAAPTAISAAANTAEKSSTSATNTSNAPPPTSAAPATSLPPSANAPSAPSSKQTPASLHPVQENETNVSKMPTSTATTSTTTQATAATTIDSGSTSGRSNVLKHSVSDVLPRPGQSSVGPPSPMSAVQPPTAVATSLFADPTAYFEKKALELGLSMSNLNVPKMPSASALLPVPIPPAANVTKKRKVDPIRLSCLAWKRRGGMGKYTTSAWERRRIELAGTRLLYYLKDDDDVGNIGDSTNFDMSTSLGAFGEETNITKVGTEESVSVFNRKATWLEKATANLVNVTAITTTSIGTSDPTQPRGYVDLAKEKATVQASFGHSGAPSPFAISIKVGVETKWKLCFDHHKTQMEWLCAITDVVVQESVDEYNASLLASADPADPANKMNELLFHPPWSQQAEQQQDAGGTAHRLWMMEPYALKSADTTPTSALISDDASDGSGAADDTTCDGCTIGDEGMADAVLVKTTTCTTTTTKQEFISTSEPESGAFAEYEDMDPTMARNEALDQAATCRVVPENNLFYMASVVNVALAVARASSTTMDGFWYLVVLVNFAIFLCTVSQPDWKSILEHVRAVQIVASESAAAVAACPGSGGDLDKHLTGMKQSSVRQVSSKTGSARTPAKPKTPIFMPKAGSSTVKLIHSTDAPVNDKNEVFAGWRTVHGDSMQVRSHGYNVTKAKVASPGELYECIHCDIFESPSRYPDMATRVKLPETKFDDGGKPKTWRSPDIFIVSIALPTDPPKFGKSSSDGGGYTVTLYFKMMEDTREMLRRITADGYDPTKEETEDPQTSKVNAVKLFEEWCRRAPTDPKFQARFKVVPNAHNLNEIGLPAWISKYNGKPFLIKRAGETGFLYTHPELSCYEFDISLHPFPYLAKQAICFMKETYFKKILVSFGFVIEGRADDELPECLIGLMQLCYPDPINALRAEDFFSGRAPKAF